MSIILPIIALLIMLAFPTLIIIFIVTAIVKKNQNKTEDGDKNFAVSVRTTYTYLLLIIFLITLITCTVSSFNSALDLLLPEETVPSSNEYYSIIADDNRDIVNKNRNIVDMVTSFTGIVVSLPFFIHFSIIAKKERSIKKKEEVKNTKKI